MLYASRTLQRERFTLPDRKLITEEITYKLDLKSCFLLKGLSKQKVGQRELVGRRICVERGAIRAWYIQEWPASH